MLAAAGDCRSRFPDPQSLAALAGAAAVTRQSGTRIAHGFRWAVAPRTADQHPALTPQAPPATPAGPAQPTAKPAKHPSVPPRSPQGYWWHHHVVLHELG